MENTLLRKLRERNIALGYSSAFPHPGLVELTSRYWDFVWLCSQHGYHDYNSIYHCMLAAEKWDVATVVRVPGHEPDYLSRVMDLAPSAIMIPQVNNVEEARAISKAVCFPPDGGRSYGGNRAISLYGWDYYKEKHTLIIAQIESEEAVKNAAEIINMPGIDMLFFSDNDMRLSMGVPFGADERDIPNYVPHMQTVVKACLDCGKLAGLVAVSDFVLRTAIEAGFTAIVVAGDHLFLRMCQSHAQEIREKITTIFNEKGD